MKWNFFNSCTSGDIVAFFKGMEIVPDGIFHCTHADGRPSGEVGFEFSDVACIENVFSSESHRLCVLRCRHLWSLLTKKPLHVQFA